MNKYMAEKCRSSLLGSILARFMVHILALHVTLPALQKFLWIFSSNLPGNFALKNGGDFAEFPLVSVSHELHEDSSKVRGNFGAKFGAKFGTKIQKIRGTFVLQLV